MTSAGTPEHPLIEPLANAFNVLVESGVVDVVPEADSEVIEIQADEWTLHLDGWPIRLAFMALDTEPASEDERLQVLGSILEPRELSAIRDADLRLEGAISEALSVSGDPLSVTLSKLVRGAS